MPNSYLLAVSSVVSITANLFAQQVSCPRPDACEFEAFSSSSFGAIGGGSTSDTDVVRSLPASSTSIVGDSLSGDGASASAFADRTTNLRLELSAQASRGGPLSIPTRSAIASGIVFLRDAIYVTGVQAPSGTLQGTAIVRVSAVITTQSSMDAAVGSATSDFNLSGYTNSLPENCFGLNGVPGAGWACSRSVESNMVIGSQCTGLTDPASSGPQIVTFDMNISNGVPLAFVLQLSGSATASMQFATSDGTAKSDYTVNVNLVDAEVLAACVNSMGQVVACQPLQPVQFASFESRRGLSVFRLGLCDSIDFNNNGIFPEDQDVIDFFSVLEGGTCSTASSGCGCNDIDFNNNGVFPEDQDLTDLFTVLAGGSCP